jgi:hypothetical protein
VLFGVPGLELGRLLMDSGRMSMRLRPTPVHTGGFGIGGFVETLQLVALVFSRSRRAFARALLAFSRRRHVGLIVHTLRVPAAAARNQRRGWI